jgi:hypothetical protein
MCLDGCVDEAMPEVNLLDCGMGDYPTVWYKVYTDDIAKRVNIHVRSPNMLRPVISLFQLNPDCSSLFLVPQTPSYLTCVEGSDGIARSMGTEITENSTYVIAITSLGSTMGSFELCVNTLSTGSTCVVESDIEITARSADGPLTGPFVPGETVSICFNVRNYTAAGNGCQWFQGLVPTFGNGWDPSSFDSDGMPLNTTLNGLGFPNADGLYGVTRWDWFTDVDYHYDFPYLQIGDHDGNGTLDICNDQYDPYCPNTGGIQGGCCAPCWGSPLGSILPPGWFAYGINGSCPTPGPPIRVDWGDGFTCGGGMGPWRFCFDLQTRTFPDCGDDSPSQDLTLGFITFADGEVGTWTGSSTVCAYDQPLQLRLPFECKLATDLGTEVLADLCEGVQFNYEINVPGIDNWQWQVTPIGFGTDSIFEGPNGYQIASVFSNPSNFSREITYTFTGYQDTSNTVFIKKVTFTLWPEIELQLPDILYICERDTIPKVISPKQLNGGKPPYTYLWNPGGQTNVPLTLYPPFQNTILDLAVSDNIGCKATDIMHVRLRPCLGDTIRPPDDNPDIPVPTDPPPPKDDLISHHPWQKRSIESNDETQAISAIRIYPVPARDKVILVVENPLSSNDKILLTDVNGKIWKEFDVKTFPFQRQHIDITDLPDGIYTITLFSQNAIHADRLIKIR